MQCDLIARGLVERGHNVVYGAVGSRQSNPPNDAGYPVCRVDLYSETNIDAVLAEFRPEVIYWRYNKRRLRFAIRSFRSRRIPFVFAVSSRDDLMPYSYRIPPTKTTFGVVRAILSSTRQAVVSRYNYTAIKSAAALTCLNKSYLPLSPVRDSVAIWNSSPSGVVEFDWPRPYICWISNIKKQKNPEAYFRLVEKLDHLVPAYDCLMVGAVQQDYYRNMIRQWESRVPAFKYLGPKSPSEVNGILKGAAVMVHTCSPEGFGNNFIQAWKQGVPTVSLNFDPDGLIVEKGLGSFSAGSETDLLQQVLFLIRNEGVRKLIGHKALVFSRQNFQDSRMVLEVEQVLFRVLHCKE